jgi:hypothetical protein
MIEMLATSLLLLGAYALSTTLAEAGEAWIAARYGDPTAKDEGWTSLNPLDHIDIIRTVIVALLGFCWVRHAPFTVTRARLSPSDIRIALVYFSQAIINTVLALAALVSLVAVSGQNALPLTTALFLYRHAPLTTYAYFHPEKSSLSIILALFLAALVSYNIFVAAIGLIAQGFRYIVMRIKVQRAGALAALEHDEHALWLSVFILLLLFALPLQSVLFQLITQGTLLCNRFLGVLS